MSFLWGTFFSFSTVSLIIYLCCLKFACLQPLCLYVQVQILYSDIIVNFFISLKFQGGKFFGKGKEGMPNMAIMGDLQGALDQECKKNKQLQEQLDRLRSENFTQANERKILLFIIWKKWLIIRLSLSDDNSFWVTSKLRNHSLLYVIKPKLTASFSKSSENVNNFCII